MNEQPNGIDLRVSRLEREVIEPSMLQDFERGRKTEIDFINGYVATLGRASGVRYI